MDDIRCYLNERVNEFGIQNELIYDRKQNGYRLEQEEGMRFSNEEVLAITKTNERYHYIEPRHHKVFIDKMWKIGQAIHDNRYRIDRIRSLDVLDEHFSIPYKDRFEEGEYRKKIQFMYGGKPQHTKFWYKGTSVEAVLDRLPTAKILKEEDGKYFITAETFGKGIDMWLRSQGDYVEVVKN